MRIQSVNDEIAQGLGLNHASGALVASVADEGPAAKAGIIAGDVVLKFNNQDVSEMRRLPRMVAESKVGAIVPIEVWRKGERKRYVDHARRIAGRRSGRVRGARCRAARKGLVDHRARPRAGAAVAARCAKSTTWPTT